MGVIKDRAFIYRWDLPSVRGAQTIAVVGLGAGLVGARNEIGSVRPSPNTISCSMASARLTPCVCFCAKEEFVYYFPCHV